MFSFSLLQLSYFLLCLFMDILYFAFLCFHLFLEMSAGLCYGTGAVISRCVCRRDPIVLESLYKRKMYTVCCSKSHYLPIIKMYTVCCSKRHYLPIIEMYTVCCSKRRYLPVIKMYTVCCSKRHYLPVIKMQRPLPPSLSCFKLRLNSITDCGELHIAVT